MSETITQNRIDYIVAIIQAADEGGVIQAGAMVHLFPGEPKRHTTTMLSHALSAAGVTREEMRAVARSEDSENESTALAWLEVEEDAEAQQAQRRRHEV